MSFSASSLAKLSLLTRTKALTMGINQKKKEKKMVENSSADSGNCSVEFVREEEEIVSKKRKNKDVDVTRFLYNDTPSDGYDEEKTPSPKAKRMMKLKCKPPLFFKSVE